jgi:hypothetical protein
VHQPQPKSLRLALFKRSTSQAIGVSLMALLSQSRAAYRNNERRDDSTVEIRIVKSPFIRVSLSAWIVTFWVFLLVLKIFKFGLNFRQFCLPSIFDENVP